jgi:ABC-type Fe3+-hydroxamate transport system substrate-binding protein
MFECKDQLGRNVVLRHYPLKRIISLVPSQTELLYDLGLDEKVIGITKFCVHPKHWFRNKERVGGTKKVNIEKIRSLQPDLILANKEENTKEQMEQLEKFTPIWISDVQTFEDALQMVKSIGEITNTTEKAASLITRIIMNFKKLLTESYGQTTNHKLQTCYLIWRNPYMTIGGDTFISDMLCKCGLQNVFEHLKRYPEISIEQLLSINPQLIFLSSEPYPFKEKHIEELTPYFQNAKIILVNGEMFSWYGSRLLYAADYFNDLIKQLNQ